MTAYQLSATRLVLERARQLLRDRRDDPDASELFGAVGETIGAIAAAEATDDFTESKWLLERARELVDRTRVYANEHGLTFLAVLKLSPVRHDTSRTLDAREVLSAIAEMEKGAGSPPPDVQERISQDQLLLPTHDTIPSPTVTAIELEPSSSRPPGATVQSFEGDDDAE